MLKNAHVIHARHRFVFAAVLGSVVLAAALLFAQTVWAQESAAADDEERTPLTAAELEELVGPIALYPDDLVGVVLPASTYPLQIVQAARYLKEHETDPELKPDEGWDDSVVALLNYPEVIELMNADLDWTWKLGEATLYQKTELLDAIQAFRDRAYAAGNLKTDEHQVVTKEEEIIVVKPADPEVIYVPYYEPRQVVVYRPYPVYHYYPRPYPVYYYPYPYAHSFGFGFFWGVTLAFTIDWHSHHVHAYSHVHHAHPYYGRKYHYPWYRRHTVTVTYGKSIWRPGYRSGSRQRHTAVVIRENRVFGARPLRKEKFRKRDHLRHRAARLDHNGRAIGPRADARGRNRPDFETRRATRFRDGSAKKSEIVRRTPRSVKRDRRVRARRDETAPMISRGVRPRTPPGRTFGSVRSREFPSGHSRRSVVPRHRDRPRFSRRGQVPARQEMFRDASPRTRSFDGAATSKRPGPRREWRGGPGPGKRFGAGNRHDFGKRSGFDSRFGPGSRGRGLRKGG